jgi:hypothetical protein
MRPFSRRKKKEMLPVNTVAPAIGSNKSGPKVNVDCGRLGKPEAAVKALALHCRNRLLKRESIPVPPSRANSSIRERRSGSALLPENWTIVS